MSSVAEENIERAIEWATEMKEAGIAEEFSLGPTTLEDAYIRMIGRADAVGTDGEAGV